MELFHAHKQWSSRPDDQRFRSVREMHDACRAYAATAVERERVALGTLRTEAVDGDVVLVGKGNVPAMLTNWAFKQLSARVGAPAGYLTELPATLAAQNLNHGLAKRVKDQGESALVNILFHRNGGILARAITSEKYSRFWNWEITERLLELESKGWAPATPDIRIIDDRLPLYASDHDMFAFMARQDVGVREPGNPLGLKRGIIVSNSEVGAGRLRYLQFLYREMCGNHIIWGAENVLDLSLVHVGNLRERMSGWYASINAYLNAPAGADEAKIVHAQSKLIAATKDEVLDKLFGVRSLGLSRKVLTAGYEAVRDDQDGDPRSVWGMAQGLTRYSQTAEAGGQFADARMTIDKAAGRLLDLAEAF